MPSGWTERARRRWRASSPLALAERFLAAVTIALPIVYATAAWWRDTTTWGIHDWDVMAAHRHLAVRSILDHGELPGWNPYACGGFPAWGYVEGATIVVSPLLPVYLLAPLALAIRLEVLVMALVGAAGAYVAAGHVARSPGARALAVALFAVNGRFGLQIAAGHTWHLAYALLPWALHFYWRATSSDGGGARRSRAVVALAVVWAWSLYAGGIYPLPHAVLALAVLAVVDTIRTRTLAPLAVLAGSGALGAGLAAPKLLPMLVTFSAAPRLVASDEVFAPAHLWIALTSPKQGFFDRPAPVTPYGWHEWGIYLGLAGVSLAVVGFFAARREHAGLRIALLLFVALGCGSFAAWAPWPWLHAHAPFFRSLHVPSRFLYPATAFAGLLAAAAAARGLAALRRTPRVRRIAALGISAVALAVALDVASVAKLPLERAMVLRAPDGAAALAASSPEFHHVEVAPIAYASRDWTPPMLLAMRANVGVLRCYGAPPFDGVGAIARGDRRYRGEAFVEGGGRAERVAFSPNHLAIRVDGAPENARVVANMNRAPGWTAEVETASGRREVALAPGDRLAVTVPEGTVGVVFRYAPPLLRVGVLVALASVVAAIGLVRRGGGAGDSPSGTNASGVGAPRAASREGGPDGLAPAGGGAGDSPSNKQ